VTDTAPETIQLKFGSVGRLGVGWWGVGCLIATEGALFTYLLFSYYYFAVELGPAFGPHRPPSMALPLPNTVILLSSSLIANWSEKAIKAGRKRRFLLGGALTVLLGAAFVAVQLVEWKTKSYSLQTNPYGSLFFTITGFHMAHVVVGLLAWLTMLAWGARGYFDQHRHTPVLITAIYWHFVDVVWIAVFTTFYLTPYLW
jgi:heme/copper-type cytochrome/quinol oxidase subunit 3